MNQNISLVDVLQKVTPVLNGNYVVVSCSELTARVEKNTFIDTLLVQYRALIESELKGVYDVEFDTEFAGCENPQHEAFLIQEVTEHNGEKQNFVFAFGFPQKNEEKRRILEIIMDWDETKLWCEYVLLLAGRRDEVFTLKQELVEKAKDNEEWFNKVILAVGDIVIHPAHYSIHPSFVLTPRTIHNSLSIRIEDVKEIYTFLTEIQNVSDTNNYRTLRIYDMYGTGHSVMIHWDTILSFHFETTEGTVPITFSNSQISQLEKGCLKLIKHAHLI